MVLRYRGGRHRPKGRSGGRNLRGRTRTRPRLAHAYPSSARRRQARPDLRRGRASPANGSRGPNRAATAQPVARTSGLALRVFRSPFAGSSPHCLRDGVGGPTIGRTARRGPPAPPMRSILGSEPPHQTQSEEGRSPDGLDRAMGRRLPVGHPALDVEVGLDEILPRPAALYLVLGYAQSLVDGPRLLRPEDAPASWDLPSAGAPNSTSGRISS
jgi:hypothetical protein